MPGYLRHARAIAATLADATGVRVVPDPPQVPMMHLLLNTTQDRFAAAVRHLAAEQGIWAWPKAMTTIDPGIQRVELSVGDATLHAGARPSQRDHRRPGRTVELPGAIGGRSGRVRTPRGGCLCKLASPVVGSKLR